MTRQAFTEKLPKFVSSQLDVIPPLMFRGVSARFFPLRANLDILQQLVDSYLNIVPSEAGHFRVPLPYVLLVVLDYGQMGESEMRTGWFSQAEVYFGIQLEWYKRVRGQWVFHDWGVITPYIFVNDDVSVPIGRTVFGFQKVLASVELTNSQWMKNPIAATTLARISTTVFPKAYSGGNLEERVFLEIEKSSLSNMHVPFDTVTPTMPWTIASNLANAIGGFGRDAFWLAQSMRLSPLGPFAGPGIIPEMLSRMAPSFTPGGRGFIVNSLNLKQFRRAEDPTKICYRALTNSCMQTTGFNRGGLLGEENTLLGDLSGGHSIRLYEHSSLPIAETLGLEISKSFNAEGVQVSELKPIMPYWVDLDMKFGQGTNIAWQTDDGKWRDGAGTEFDAKVQPDPPFNNTVSTTIEAIAGPFQFTGTTIRVIPLLADRKTLQKTLDDYLNVVFTGKDGEAPPKIVKKDQSPAEYTVRFDLWARDKQAINTDPAFGGEFAYVYLTASSFDGVISQADNVGNWAKYELAFMAPVKWQRMKVDKDGRPAANAEWETVGVGLVPLCTLADNCITAMSRLEIQGIDAGTANFVRPESVWLGGGNDQANAMQTMLRVDVELLPALGAGQKANFQPVVEISMNDPSNGLGPAPDTPWRWAEDLRHELGMKKGVKQQYFEELKTARALSLELLGNQIPFSLYTLKEFRDVTDPNKACYQSIVRVPRVLREVFDVREIEETLAVKIYGYPSMNLVKSLGLQAARLDDGAAGIGYSMQGLRPFYIRATVDEHLGQRLIWRAGTDPWTMDKAAFETMLMGTPKITVDGLAETLQDEMDPSRTAETMFQARQRMSVDAAVGPVTIPQAAAALKRIDPQTVIESILSREWSNFDPNARWRKGRLALMKGFGALPQAGVLKPLAEAELYRQINNLLAAPPGAVAAPISLSDLLAPPQISESTYQVMLDNLAGIGAAKRWRSEVTKIIESQRSFSAVRLQLEQSIDLLSPLAILGLEGVRSAYEMIAKNGRNWQRPVSTDLAEQLGLQQFESPDQPPVQETVPPPPTEETFVAAGKTLLMALDKIANMSVEGEPSPHFNLDTVALAEEIRLRELYQTLKAELEDELKNASPKAALEKASAHSTEEGQMVSLARDKCQVQYEALINKLSRAYQKPDFCLRRDSLSPADRDRLLPMALSWDPDWYYGDVIELNPGLAGPVPNTGSAQGQSPTGTGFQVGTSQTSG